MGQRPVGRPRGRELGRARQPAARRPRPPGAREEQSRDRREDRATLFAHGGGNDHAACAHARTAARIAADRSSPSRSARSISSASSASENRVGMTRDARSARGGRPHRFCNSSTSYPASASSAHACTCASDTSRPWITRLAIHSLYYVIQNTSTPIQVGQKTSADGASRSEGLVAHALESGAHRVQQRPTHDLHKEVGCGAGGRQIDRSLRT